MSEFGDISRMDLSGLEKKGSLAEDANEVPVNADAEPEDGNETAGLPDSGDDAAEVEVIDTKEHMDAPQGKHYYIDAKITPKEMRAFLFAHNYTSPLMIIATLVGFAWPVYTVIKAEGSVMVALLCAAVFLILMPFSIWRRATMSIKQNPLYENTFHYLIDEKGIHLEIGNHAVDVDWKMVTRKMFLPSTAVIYTGKVNAYLIPTAAMGERKDEIVQFIKDHT